ncbi:hypothetical protein D3C81_1394790 [compost metagenome]
MSPLRILLRGLKKRHDGYRQFDRHGHDFICPFHLVAQVINDDSKFLLVLSLRALDLFDWVSHKSGFSGH